MQKIIEDQLKVLRAAKKKLQHHEAYLKRRATVKWQEAYHTANHKRRSTPEGRAVDLKANLRTRYGLTSEQYDELVSAEVCPICERKFDAIPDKKRKHIDHDHTTGQVRKVLCRNCNHMLGGARDDPKVLAAGIEYLKTFGKAL